MTERPILFSAPMVRAILEGRKTQTRRIVKPLPSWQVHSVCEPSGAADPWAVWFHYPETDRVGHLRECPYGKPGDRLWVRETFYCDHYAYPDAPIEDMRELLEYRASHDCSHWEAGCPCLCEGRTSWRPSIHMPRWASRITLEIADVRVQRLQDISAEDCESEGIVADLRPGVHFDIDGFLWPAGVNAVRALFRDLWQSINGEGSWDENPWVWALTFKSVSI